MIAISFVVYSLLIVGVGLYSAKFAKQSEEDFHLAGRSLSGWVAALSASASSESGWVTLGLVGWAFTQGVSAYWIMPGCLLGFLFNWFVIAKPLRKKSVDLGAMTLPDLFALHFKEKKPILRFSAMIVIIIAMVLYVAAQFAAAGKSFSATFPGMDYKVGVLIGAGIVLIYTVAGGFRAVCWTDFVQALLMLGTLVLFPIYLLVSELNVSQMIETLRQADPKLLQFFPNLAPLAFLGFLLGSGALGINFGYAGQPHVLARFMSLKDANEAKLGGVVSFLWGFFVYAGAVTIGLIARAMTEGGAAWGQMMLDKPDIYGELGLILASKHLIPGVLSGMVLAAVLAAICSTADSQLAVAGSLISKDLMDRILKKRKGKSSLALDRLAILGIGLLAILLVIDEEVRVYKYVLVYGWAILGAAFGPQIILLLFWRGTTWIGSLLGVWVGFWVAVIWPQIYDASSTGVEIYNLPLAFIASLLVNMCVSSFSSPK